MLGLTRSNGRTSAFPGYWLDAGDVQVHLIEIEGHEAPAGQHFAFRVDDVGRRPGPAGRTWASRSASRPWIPGPVDSAFFHDPAGNLIELNQPEAPA